MQSRSTRRPQNKISRWLWVPYAARSHISTSTIRTWTAISRKRDIIHSGCALSNMRYFSLHPSGKPLLVFARKARYGCLSLSYAIHLVSASSTFAMETNTATGHFTKKLITLWRTLPLTFNSSFCPNLSWIVQCFSHVFTIPNWFDDGWSTYSFQK